MKKNILFLYFVSLLTAVISYAEGGTRTQLMVRAKAKDAKFIGSSIGGARIVVREAFTGQILAEGFTSGSTGDTDRIMKSPHLRHETLADAETAGFSTSLELEKPILLTIQGYAPWNQPQARIKVETQVWLIPGKDISGDGIILEFPGLLVNMLNPQTHERIVEEKEIPITANVVLMCGCPITEGGIWDANEYEVRALIERNGESIQEIPLHITDKANTFSGLLKPSAPGLYQATVYAFHPKTGNSGVATTNFIVK